MWSYDKPEKTGKYFVNKGDVVTELSLEIIKVTFDCDYNLIDNEDFDISLYYKHFKFTEYDSSLSIDDLNKMGNGYVNNDRGLEG